MSKLKRDVGSRAGRAAQVWESALLNAGCVQLCVCVCVKVCVKVCVIQASPHLPSVACDMLL